MMKKDELLEIEAPVKKNAAKKPEGFMMRLWKNFLFRNIVYAAVGLLLLVFLVNFSLLLLTQHNRTFPVPDFSGMTLEEALAIKEAKHLRLEIIDSVYVAHRPRGAIFRQLPEPETAVKKNRRVLLTINAHSPRKVTAPEVVGYSLRQAKAVLLSQGLAVGKLNYEPDIATNNVLAQYYNGRVIREGSELNAGSEIDLVLGRNLESGQRTVIPSVTGLSAEAAKDVLLDNSLNCELHYDKSVKNYADSLAAHVYRQMPSASPSNVWNLGTTVELYLKP
ncbi:MAG: PASTA domain-containing protein [Prevotellaceae bacterium]|jgi:beta-lactam-binding protein with PASTA domain|nr:PASTA domain-containing protein [Prevotellaceae bacterium]